MQCIWNEGYFPFRFLWGVQCLSPSAPTKPAEITVSSETSTQKCGWVHRRENPTSWTPLMKICISKHDKKPSPCLFPPSASSPTWYSAAEFTGRPETSGMQGEPPKKPRKSQVQGTLNLPAPPVGEVMLQGAPKFLSSIKEEKFSSEVKDDNPKDHRTLPEWPGVNLPRFPYAFYCFQTKDTSETAFTKGKQQQEGECSASFDESLQLHLLWTKLPKITLCSIIMHVLTRHADT